mmetsp:Transcript_22020/g.52211  ORF Transcript_22020/g.52211 Transcript_22020/m.52211 type:complete len:250 (+) Transcript_22020:2-751(+)
MKRPSEHSASQRLSPASMMHWRCWLCTSFLVCVLFCVADARAEWKSPAHIGGRFVQPLASGCLLQLRGGSSAWRSPRREGSRPRLDRSPVMLSEELDEEEDFVDYVEKSTVKIRKEKEREHLVEQFGGGLDSCLKKHESVLERRKRLAREARAKRKEKELELLSTPERAREERKEMPPVTPEVVSRSISKETPPATPEPESFSRRVSKREEEHENKLAEQPHPKGRKKATKPEPSEDGWETVDQEDESR